MSTIPTCAVFSTVRDSVGGEPLANATVTARLSSYEIYNGFVVPRDISAKTDADGYFVIDLFPNELGSASSFYDIKIIAPNGKTLRSVAVVPNDVTADLSAISELPPYEGKPDGAILLAAVIAARTATEELRDEASASAVAAAQSATAAQGSEDQVAADALTASNAADSASNDATASSQSKVDAQAAQSKAQQWATKTDGEVEVGQGRGAKYYAEQAVITLASTAKTADLADTTDETKGSGRLGFNALLNYAAGTLGAFVKTLATRVELALSGGAGLIGTPDGTVQDALDERVKFSELGADDGSSLLGFIQAGSGAVARTAQDKQRDELNVLDFGADPTGAMDSTLAIQAASAALSIIGSGVLRGRGTFKVAIAQGQSLCAFTGKSNITLDFSGAVIDNSSVSYTADAFTPIFLFDGGYGFDVRIGKYVGYTLPTPATYLGYRGATLVRAINGAKNIRVNANADNLRYGFQTGEYGDAAKGNCAFIDVKIHGSMIGYPIAAYLADHIHVEADVDGVHRAAYIAGCDGVTGIVKWRDQYIADTALLITDALRSGTDAAAQADPVGAPTTSRGTSNLRMSSIDKGSAVFQSSSRCAGISLSRVDPVQFRNIEVTVSTKGTDTVSTTVGGWGVVSGAKAIWNRYPLNWSPNIVFDNVKVSGVVDHSACTLPGNTGSEFYMNMFDATVADGATVRNFSADNFVFLPSSGNLRASFFYVPGLANAASFVGFDTPGVGLNVLTNSTKSTVLGRGRIGALDVSSVSGGSRMTIGPGAIVDSQSSNVLITNTTMTGGAISGAGFSIQQKLIKIPALSGASVSVANAFLAGDVVYGVQGIIKTTIPGPTTGINVGIAGTPSRYANQNILAAGSKFTITAAATDADRLPHVYLAATALVVTAKTADFAGGELWIAITYGRFPDMA